MLSSSDIDRLDRLAEEFVALYRAGQRPSLSEFIASNKDLADEIRDLFPTLALMEEARATSSASSGDSQDRIPTMKMPERIGEYRILQEVGRGGMGIVYEAIQESLGRQVALKILPTHALLDTRQLQRFQREARSAARLHHTNIVSVFGVGVHEGLHYYAMQFIRGVGLDQVIAELKQARREKKAHRTSSAELGSQPTNTSGSSFTFPGSVRNSSLPDSSSAYWLGVARVGAQVADALHYANTQGVLHRDIKPSNLLLDSDGTVWVTDFGLAKDSMAENSPGDVNKAALTQTGDIVGTLRYMAPEVLRGQSDSRSDIYSLGATLYELLTLHPAFDESDRSVFMRRLLHDEPPRPRSFDATIPIDLETIVVKAMAKEPQDRYASASELAEDLRRFLADRPIRARRISSLERAWRTCRRNPLIASLSLAVVVLIATLTVGFQMAAWIDAERDLALISAERASKAEQSARVNLQRATDAERDAKIAAHLTQAIVQRKRDLPGRRLRAIREIKSAIRLSPSSTIKHDLRNEMVATLALNDIFTAREWSCRPGSLAVDTKFETYAIAARDGTISLRSLEDDREIRTLQRAPGPDSRASLKFSRDGTYLASFTFDKHVLVWRISDGQLVYDDYGCCWELSYDFTPDSRKLVVGHEHEALVIDLESKEILTRWPIEFPPWCLTCGPVNDLVAITPEGNDSSRKLQIYSWSTPHLIKELVAPKWIYSISWHPNGQTIAYGCGDASIYLWNIADALPNRKLSGLLSLGISVAFSHDGSMLASSSWGQEFYIWDYETGERLCSDRFAMPCLQFSPDDSQIALFQNGSKIGIYGLVRSDIFRYFVRGGTQGNGNGLLNAAFSKDGRLLVVGSEKGLSVYEYPSGQEKSFAAVGQTRYLRFDAGGNLLASSNQLMRWPMHTFASSNHYVIGPPEKLPIATRSEFDISRDGEVLIVAGYDSASVFNPNAPATSVVLSPHEDCRYVAISPDGKLAATASHFGSKVKVWDAASGRLLITLPIESSSWVRFSPDGKWLATPVGARHLWRVGTWEAGADMGGLVAGFSQDGKILAVDDLAGAVHLLDPESGREYVRLEHPQGYGADRYFFTPDGNELIAIATARQSGFAWHLGRIQQALSGATLDWDLPQSAPSTASDSQQPVSVELKTTTNSVPPFADQAKAHIQQCRDKLVANPNDAFTCNELAWALLFSPTPLRDSSEAVRLAKVALSLKPDDLNYRNTLGVALYRDGRYQEAIDCLSENIAMQNDEGLPFDLFFLAMSHYQLGDEQRAHEMLVWAKRWCEKHAATPGFEETLKEQLDEIQREAEELFASKSAL